MNSNMAKFKIHHEASLKHNKALLRMWPMRTTFSSLALMFYWLLGNRLLNWWTESLYCACPFLCLIQYALTFAMAMTSLGFADFLHWLPFFVTHLPTSNPPFILFQWMQFQLAWFVCLQGACPLLSFSSGFVPVLILCSFALCILVCLLNKGLI